MRAKCRVSAGYIRAISLIVFKCAVYPPNILHNRGKATHVLIYRRSPLYKKITPQSPHLNTVKGLAGRDGALTPHKRHTARRNAGEQGAKVGTRQGTVHPNAMRGDVARDIISGWGF